CPLLNCINNCVVENSATRCSFSDTKKHDFKPVQSISAANTGYSPGIVAFCRQDTGYVGSVGICRASDIIVVVIKIPASPVINKSVIIIINTVTRTWIVDICPGIFPRVTPQIMVGIRTKPQIFMCYIYSRINYCNIYTEGPLNTSQTAGIPILVRYHWLPKCGSLGVALYLPNVLMSRTSISES